MTQIHWANPVNGDFRNGADWTGGVVPGAADDAILDAPGTTPYTVATSANETVGSLETAANARLAVTSGVFDALAGTGSGANAGLISVADGARLTVSGGVDNIGAIALTGAALGARLTIGASGATFTGGGTIAIDDRGAGMSEIAGGLLTNLDNTISGHVEVFAAGVVNGAAGVIDASGANPSEIDALSAQAIVNTGLIEATGVGGVFIVADKIDQSGGGVLFAGAGSTMLLLTTVVGGTLIAAGGGVIEADTATFDGARSAVTNLGAVVVAQAGALTLAGTIDNVGSISLTDAKYPANLVIGQKQAVLTGGGTIFLGADGRGVLIGSTATTTLVNIDNAMAGAGRLGDGRLTLVNKAAGVIDANAGLGLILDTGAGAVINAGLIEATGKAGLTIRGASIDNSAGGVIEAASGSHVGLQGATVIGGTLKSVGTGAIQTFGAGNTLDGTASSVTNQASLILLGKSTLAVAGAIDNAGLIELGGQGVTLTVDVGGATLSGGGRVTLLGKGGERIVGATASATLTNIDNIIAGAGRLGGGALTLVNRAKGAIVGSRGAALVIDTGTSTIVNDGLIGATGAGGVTIASAVANDGVLQARGGMLTLDGAISGTGEALIEGGTLDVAGPFSQKVVFRAAGGTLEMARS